MHVGLIRISNGDLAVLLNKDIVQTAESEDGLILAEAVGQLAVTLAEKFGVLVVHYGIDIGVLSKEWSWNDVAALLENSIEQNMQANQKETRLNTTLTAWEEQRRQDEKPYAAELMLRPDGITIAVGDQEEDRPELEVLVEINQGVPAVHIGGQLYGDMELHIHSAPEGLCVSPDTPGAMEQASNEFTYSSPGYVISQALKPTIKP